MLLWPDHVQVLALITALRKFPSGPSSILLLAVFFLFFSSLRLSLSLLLSSLLLIFMALFSSLLFGLGWLSVWTGSLRRVT